MVKFRLYYDKDKEEIWLNEMAQQGYAMTRFFRAGAIFESALLVYELILTGINWYQLGSYSGALLLCDMIIIVVVAAFWNICYRTRKKIKSLEEELF